ncbi:MAG TPA: hypothetical protein VFZ68_14030, partial [Acidimicrobiales bacterium]
MTSREPVDDLDRQLLGVGRSAPPRLLAQGRLPRRRRPAAVLDAHRHARVEVPVGVDQPLPPGIVRRVGHDHRVGAGRERARLPGEGGTSRPRAARARAGDDVEPGLPSRRSCVPAAARHLDEH